MKFLYNLRNVFHGNETSLPLIHTDHEYKLKGKEVLEQAWQLLNSDGWSLEKQNSDGDTVHSKSVPKVGKIFKLSGLVDIPPRKLLDEVYYKIEEVPNWNPTLTKCKTLHTIDNHTDISYQVAAEAGGGLVSSRDFVNLRHWEMRGDVYIAAGVSTTHPKMPPQKNFVRGENGPGAWVMRPVEGDPNKCLFQWLLNTNLKGWIPQYIIDQTLSVVMLDYIRHIRNYSDEMRRQEVL